MPNFWPSNIQGAVSLTFDDALLTQLDNAIPCLDDHNLKGTFYVNPGRKPTWQNHIPRWQQASKNGHEIGNHTSQHPCSCNFGFRKDGFCLENLSLDDIAQTIDEATEDLDALFPEQNGERTFCYPCYQSYVGAGENRQSYVPLVAKRFKAARGFGERPNNPALIDLSYTWSFALNGQDGQAIINYIESAISQGQWAILCMHGVGGEHISIETAALQDAVRYLDKNRETIWTGTMIELANYILAQRTKT
ncbi:MAG: polysaccharide deacetylase family protein [bacterium]|nr:polysaccharide deacetylase family protein [bacterium]